MNFKERVGNWKRVLQVARKPSRFEFTSTSKICALGLLVIGVVGFVIFILATVTCSFGGLCL
jgi:protein transport protein SEC61 subunit gamma-like protein